MHKITFFANKGGSGRTTSTMALASGFLAQGKRVAVLDCSDLAGYAESPLRAWLKQMETSRLSKPELNLIESQTREEVEDAVAAAQTSGVEVLLIDTPARIYEPQAVALNFADLVIAPAIGPLDSKRISAGISEHLDEIEKVLGLVICFESNSPQAAKTRQNFGYNSVLKSELPWAEVLSEQMLNGDIAHFVAKLARQPGEPGFARFRQAQLAWTAVQRLTFEIEWALNGRRLEQFIDSHHQSFCGRKSVA